MACCEWASGGTEETDAGPCEGTENVYPPAGKGLPDEPQLTLDPNSGPTICIPQREYILVEVEPNTRYQLV